MECRGSSIGARGIPGPDGSVRRSMVWTLLGRFAQAGAQAGLLVVVARLGSAEMVGELALAMALCSPIMVIVGLQLRVVLVTDLSGRFGWADHVGLRRRASALGVALATLIAAVPGLPISVAAVLAVALGKAGELSSDLHHATFQRRGAMRLYARSVATRAILGLTAASLVLFTTGRLGLGLFAMAAVSWAVALIHDAPRSKGLRGPVRSAGPLRELLWVAAPLGLVTFVDSITQHAVRLQVDAMLGTIALGHYAVMSYAVVAGGAVVFALGTPLLPRLAEHHAAGRHRVFTRIAGRLVGLSALLGVGGIAFAGLLGRPFLGLVFGVTFESEADVFPWVMTAGALHFVLGSLMHAVNAAQQRRAQPWIYLTALGVTLAAGWLWIPVHGLRGAAWASSAGWAVAIVIASAILLRACTSRRRP